MKGKDDGALLRNVLPASKKIGLIGQPSDVVTTMVQAQAALEEEAAREEAERKKRQGALERLQLMRAAEEQRERERYAAQREEEERIRAEERRQRMEEMRRNEVEEEMQPGKSIEFDMNIFRFVFLLFFVFFYRFRPVPCLLQQTSKRKPRATVFFFLPQF